MAATMQCARLKIVAKGILTAKKKKIKNKRGLTHSENY